MTNADLVYYNGPWTKTPRDIVARQAFIKRTRDGTPNIGNTIIKIPLHSYDRPPLGRLPPSGYANATITHKSLASIGTRTQPQPGRRSLQRLKSKTRPEDNPPDAMDMINEYNKIIDTAMENVESPKIGQPSPVIKSKSPIKFGNLDIQGDDRMTGPADLSTHRTRAPIVSNPDISPTGSHVSDRPHHNLTGLADHQANISPTQGVPFNDDLLKAMKIMDEGGWGSPSTSAKPNEINTKNLFVTPNSSTVSPREEQIRELSGKLTQLRSELTKIKGNRNITQKMRIAQAKVKQGEINATLQQRGTLKDSKASSKI